MYPIPRALVAAAGACALLQPTGALRSAFLYFTHVLLRLIGPARTGRGRPVNDVIVSHQNIDMIAHERPRDTEVVEHLFE